MFDTKNLVSSTSQRNLLCSPVNVPHKVGTFVPPTTKASVKHWPWYENPFPAAAAGIMEPPMFFPTESVLVEGPVMTNVSKSKRT